MGLFSSIKGPKALLSSAIATALNEFFVVDAERIESNLLRDAKIVLQDVELKPQTKTLPGRGDGGGGFGDGDGEGALYKAVVTGRVKRVTFSWAWAGMGGSGGDDSESTNKNSSAWVRDAVLTIDGIKFQATIEECNDEGQRDDFLKSSAAVAETIERKNVASNSDHGDAGSGGIRGYIQNQVLMILDSLTLEVVNFDFTVIMPPTTTTTSTDENGELAQSSSSIVIGGRKVELVSFGRHRQHDDETSTSTAVVEEEGTDILRQRLSIDSFFANIVIQSSGPESEKSETLPLMDKFSYAAEATRIGDRFGDFTKGMTVVGRSGLDNVGRGSSGVADGGLVVHAGSVQLETLKQLGLMVLAPPGQQQKTEHGHVEEAETSQTAHANSSSPSPGVSDNQLPHVSNFSIPLSSAKFIVMEDTTMTVPNIDLYYKADGTAMNFKADGFQLEKAATKQQQGSTVSVRGLDLSLRPQMTFNIGVIERVFVPGVLELTKPILGPKLSRDGETLSVDVDVVDLIILNKADEASSSNSSIQEAQINPSSTSTTFAAPFPFSLVLKNGRATRAADGSVMQLRNTSFFVSPGLSSEKKPITHVALELGEFRNELLYVKDGNLYATLPVDGAKSARNQLVVEGFNFAAELVSVTAGHSTNEWSAKFKPAEKVQKTIGSSPAVIRLPNAKVAPLNMKIAWKGKGVSVKDTSITVKPFVGNADTTSADLINYYISCCLSKVPGFISNADVLGLNVVDSTVSGYGAWLGLAAGLGPGSGVAAIAAVDGVKGAVASGKKSRGVQEGESWRPGDLVRGIVYSASATAKSGADKRGKNGKGRDSNVIADFSVGMSDATGKYVGDNKSRLGAAGGAGAGMVVGSMLGGPIGGILGALAASKVTGTAIDRMDAKKSDEKKSDY